MKISTKGRYAMWLMLDLAEHAEEGCASVKSIAQRQGISDKYLEQIIKSLSEAGLVESHRGKQGGYTLTKPVQEYTVGEILRVTEGSLALVSCVEDASCCAQCGGCVTKDVWQKISDAINDVVDHITLDTLVQKQKDSPHANRTPCHGAR